MGAECARCGSCCDPVTLDADVYAEVMEDARSSETLGPNRRFIAQHWRILSAYPDEDGKHWLRIRCDVYDPLHRACSAHEDRPPVCKDFPWYEEEPGSEGRAEYLNRQCSYLADIPPSDRPEGSRPLIPLTVLRG